jgi:hypothetical protein
MGNRMTPLERAKVLLDADKEAEAKRQAKVNARIEQRERRFAALKFKDDTREMTVVGKYLLAKLSNRSLIEARLKEADISDHDLKFFRQRGWSL